LKTALIVSEKSVAYFTETLTAAYISQILTVSSCGEARRTLLMRDFDLVLINAPLKDESGEKLARDIASKGMVILAVASEHYEEVSALCENDGVLTISKPINKNIFWSAIKLTRAAHNRLLHVYTENDKLKQKIKDIRITDRAKCILISYLNMSEQEAHRYIEKQAMDMRIPKKAVAERIIKTYEND